MTGHDHLAVERLSAQQRRVFCSAVTGTSPQEIAVRLGIRPKTVYDHLQHIYRALGVAGKDELLYLARVHWDCCELERYCRDASR
jgi:DNA-binding CsgD family transcriptional regulator